MLRLRENLRFGALKIPTLYISNIPKVGSDYTEYESAIKSFAKIGDTNKIDICLKQMINKDDHTPKKYILHHIIYQSINIKKDVIFAINILKQYNKIYYNCTDPRTYESILIYLTKSGKMDDSESIINTLKDKNIQLNEKFYAYMVNGYLIINNFQKASFYINQMIENNFIPSVKSINTWLIRILKSTIPNEKIDFIREIIFKYKIKIDTQTYNLILESIVQNKSNSVIYLNNVNCIVNEMNSNSIPFDIITYQHLIKAYSIRGVIHKVLSLKKQLETQRFTITGVMFVDIINMYVNANQLKKAEDFLFGNIISFEDHFFQFALSSLLHAYAKQGKSDEIKILLENISQANFKKDDIMILGIITGLIQSNDIQNAFYFYNLYRDLFDNEKVSIIYNTLAQKYADLGDIDNCLSTIEIIQSDQNKVAANTYICLMFAYFDRKNKVEGNKLSKFILKEQKLNIMDYIKVIDTFIGNKDHFNSRLWVDKMCDENLYPSQWYKEDKNGKIISADPKRPKGQKFRYEKLPNFKWYK